MTDNLSERERRAVENLIISGGFNVAHARMLYDFQCNTILKDVCGPALGQIRSKMLCYHMGLGKTVVSMAIGCGFFSPMYKATTGKNKKILVVCPKAVVQVWEDSFKEWTSLSVSVLTTPSFKKNGIDDSDVQIVTYGTLCSFFRRSCGGKKDVQMIQTQDGWKPRHFWNKKHDCPLLDKYDPCLCIFDEIHEARNIDSLINKSCSKIKAFYKLLLTGTPIHNDPSEMAALCRISGIPTIIKKWKRMKTKINIPYVRDFKGRHMIVKTKDILNLPPCQETEHRFTLKTKQEISIYNILLSEAKEAAAMVRKNDKASMARLSRAIGRLKRCIFHPKMVAKLSKEKKVQTAVDEPSSKMIFIAKNIDEMLLYHGKIIVVCEEVQMMRAIRQYYKKTRNVSSVMYFGDQSITKRRKILDDFRNKNECRILYLSLNSGGVGLTLTEATGMIFMSLWYNYQKHLQARDRIHRLGQREDTEVRTLICDLTFESSVRKLQFSKENCAKAIVDDDYSWVQGNGSDSNWAKWRLEKAMLSSLQRLKLPSSEQDISVNIEIDRDNYSTENSEDEEMYE
ncbi:putative Snf2 family helicase [Tetraselmis virus 1]|uniref:Putative Snf2 family helicase n=1 Tax=Tetraselmis virus 1 TaxID=2060617 RepID=A0A2P0VMN8_9VIRU|nr:putative Snf2 family helicase [Tetraselmis virus 1]AUF82167.1 putative Snf2 family helicase [Tetraselmis virus 1]